MYKTDRITILALTVLLTALACGFQPRGQGLQALQNTHVYIQQVNAPKLSEELKKQLRELQVSIVTEKAAADYLLTLNDGSYSKRGVSVSATTGKFREYEITYTAMFKITETEQTEVLLNSQINMTREYTFNEAAVLSNAEEEQKLREYIIEQAAGAVIRQLRAVIL